MEKRHTESPKRKRKAASTDVLPPDATAHKIPPRWREHYQRLLKLRDDLADEQSTLSQEAKEQHPTFSTHMADAGTDTYDRDFALGMLSSEQDAVYEIDAALERIREGTYGICELTGKPIEAARLEAIPWTRFSAKASKQLENEGEFKRASLGPRESARIAPPTGSLAEDDSG
jgi:DnaK suppressor protein